METAPVGMGNRQGHLLESLHNYLSLPAFGTEAIGRGLSQGVRAMRLTRKKAIERIMAKRQEAKRRMGIPERIPK